MSSQYVYALTCWKDCKKVYFYVGRTSRPQGVRLHEHRTSTRTTSVYKYINEQVPAGIFEEEVLSQISDDMDAEDSEFFWVVKMIREGHDIQNERNGDAKRVAAIECAKSSIQINNLNDVRNYKRLSKCQLRNDITYNDSGVNKTLQNRLENRQKPYKTETKSEQKDRIHRQWIMAHNNIFE